MSIIKPSVAWPSGQDWISAVARAFMTDQTPIAVDTVQDVRDNDFEQSRWIYLLAKGAFYRLNLSSVAADDGDMVLRDNVGRRYEKLGGGIREKLTANRTYYVRTDGSDTNNGLANTSGGAFLTIQKVITSVQAIDLAGFTVTIQVGAGTYTTAISAIIPWVGGSVTLRGDPTTTDWPKRLWPCSMMALSPMTSGGIWIPAARHVGLRLKKPRLANQRRPVRSKHG